MALHRRSTLALSTLLLLPLLPACGGGGEDAWDVVITLDKSSITIEGDAGLPLQDVVTATVHGTPKGTIFVGYETTGEGIDSVQLSLGTDTASLAASTSSTRAPGRYTGTLKVLACADQACSRHLGGSPFLLPFTVTLHAVLKATPGTLTLSAVSGTGTSGPVTVQLPEGSSDFTVETSPQWLSATDVTPGSFTAVAAPLPAGYRTGYVTVRAGGRSVQVVVNYQVSAPPGGEHGLAVTPTSLAFSGVEGAAAPAQLLLVTPPTWGPPLTTSVTYAGPVPAWLTVTATAGGYELVADAGPLAAGTYTATLAVQGDAYTYAQYVSIAFTVAKGLVKPPDQVVTVSGTSVAGDLQRAVPIALVAGPPRAWTAVSDSPLVRLDAPAGTTGGDLALTIDQPTLAAMANGTTAVATVTVTPSPATIAPARFTVTVAKSLPEIRFVSPSAQPTGGPHRLRARGLGFDAVPDLASRLVVEGIEGVTVTRLSDGELLLDVPDGAVGPHEVRLSNALGFAAATAALRLYAAADVAYAAIPLAGAKRGLVHDAAAQVLYAVDADQQRVLRLAFDGAAWVQTTRAITAVQDVGLSPDGATLVVTTSAGDLRLLDPETLADRATYHRSPGFSAFSLSAGLPVTNDGKVWLAFGTGGWNTLGWFDLVRSTFAPAPLAVQTSFYGGPWFSLSRDGERLLLTQTAGVSPAPPMLWLDAVDGVLRTAPANRNFFYQASQSDDGGRVFLDGDRVYDAGYAPVGDATMPSGYFARGVAMSPSGHRAYVLAYPYTFPSASSPGPRLLAFDSSAAPASGTALPLVGSVDLADYPTCRVDAYGCNTRTLVTISADGRTLFVAGDAAVLVVPVPAGLR